MRAAAGIVAVALGVGLVLAGAELGVRAVEDELPPERRTHDAVADAHLAQVPARTDVLFVGTSAAQQAFLPSVVERAGGATAYNASVPAATPKLVQEWLPVLLRRTSPATVVWGITPLDLTDGFGAEALDAWRAARADGPVDRVLDELGEHSRLVERRATLANLHRADDVVEVAADGHRGQRRGEVTEDGRRLLAQDLAGGASDEQWEALVATVAALREDGVEVVLVELPVADELEQRAAAAMPGWQEQLRSVAAGTGAGFVDLHHDLGDGDLLDLTHVREQAAARLTALLVAPPADLPVAASIDLHEQAQAALRPRGAGSLDLVRNVDELARFRQLHARLAAGRGAPQVLLLGDSLTRNAVDPVQLHAATGLDAVQASVAASSPRIVEEFLRLDLLPMAGMDLPERAVVGVSPVTWLVDERRDAGYDARSLRRELYRPSPSTPAFGDALPAVAPGSTVASHPWWQRSEQEFGGGRGRYVRYFDSENAEGIGGRLAAIDPDGAATADLDRLVGWLADAGVQVTLVELPLPAATVAQLPDGAGTVERLREVTAEVAAAHGAEHLVAPGDVGFVDATHVGEDGAATITAWLAQELGGPGAGA